MSLSWLICLLRTNSNMPARTSGFAVQAQPGMNYLPAASLVPNLSGIIPAASQGAGFISQLAQISDEAQAAPLRRQLEQIHIQQAQDKLNEPEQPLERILGTDIRRIPRISSPEDTPAMDANGNYTFAEGDTNYDLTPVQRVQVTDKHTGLSSIQERALTPISTSETLGERQDRLDLARVREESLGTSRQATRELAIERLNNSEWKRFGYGVDNNGKQVYLLINAKTGQRQEVPTDLIPVPTGMDALTGAISKLSGGGSGGSAPQMPTINFAERGAQGPGPAAATAVAPEDTPASIDDPEVKAFVDQIAPSFKVQSPQAPAFKSANDVKAAFKSGALPRDQAEKILREQFGLK